MCGPCCSAIRLFVDENFGARGCKGGPIEIKRAKDEGLGRELGVDVG